MQGQVWDAALYDRKHAFVYAYGQDLIPLLDPKPGERILDLGCGTGHLTAAIAKVGATVVGLDRSPEMIAAARQNFPELTFREDDASAFQVDEPFDAVFSNATLHWVPGAEGVVRSVAAALRPGGRFVAEFGGRGNVARIVTALQRATAERAGASVRHPWYFPSVGQYAALLERHGLEVRHAALFDRLTPLEDGDAGMRNWLAMFAGSMLAMAPAEQREAVIAQTEELLRPELYRDGVWHADYRRIRVAAVRDPSLTTG
jgi:trans-aconitate 2-methyltransferase